MSLPISKIYVDSRWCTSDSVSASNFKVQLPTTLQCPDNTVFFINDVCIPHTWKTVEENINDTLYFMTVNMSATTSAGLYVGKIIKLAPGNYTPTTFATELQTRLRESVSSTFSVTVDGTAANSGVKIQNSNTGFQWKLLTDDDLIHRRYYMNNLDYNPYKLMSANDIINNIETDNVVIGGDGSSVQFYSSGFLNLNWINNVYITSPNLGSFNTIFAGRGDNNIVKKVPVLVNYGYMIVDQVMSTNDYLDCSKQTLQTIEFHLKAAKGDYIPLHGAHVSFFIVFNRYNLNQ